ncbi:MAG: RHS repeat-associated core domain-containing protein [Uliginosibacterium sp.]|nr:RHS repeat-associated core domain-containing protein [Uliginosibacterium sp.]
MHRQRPADPGTRLAGRHAHRPDRRPGREAGLRRPARHPRRITDTTGKALWKWNGEAFGLSAPNEDADGDGKALTYNLRFPGQVFDKESNLHYNWHRYYDPGTGRYVSSDPIGLNGGINTYAYAKGSPIRKIDPTGLTVLDFDPNKGVLYVDPQIKGRRSYTMPASSGRPNCGCDSSTPDKGPIPSGKYSLNKND